MASTGVGSSALDDYDGEIEKVFHVVPPSQKKEVKRVIMNKAILSSTNLQLLLYYNAFYSLAFTWFFALAFRWKYLNNGGLRVTYFTPIFFSIWCVSECLRLYVGYKGNLLEDTPNMAAFLFLTIFPQMLITIYFLSMQTPLYHFDRIFSGIMLAFLIVEFLLAWRQLGAFISDKTARFSVEYGGVEGRPADGSEQTDVVALNEYIYDDADPRGQMADDFRGVDEYAADGLEETRPSARRVRTMPLSAMHTQAEASRLISAPSREGTMSFGGPSVVPITAGQRIAPSNLTRSMPRGSAAPLPPIVSASYRGAASFASASGFSASARGIGAASADRELETPEQRAARRARDRAIITGQLVPERRRDYDAENREEIQQEQERLAMQQAQTLDRLSTSRPVLGSLSAASAAVRIPFTPSLASPQKRE